MATHEIKLKVTKGIEVLNTDIEIQVKRNGTSYGTLAISKGSIDWKPAGSKVGIPLKWTQFDKAMRGYKQAK